MTTVSRIVSIVSLILLACYAWAGEDGDFRKAHGYYTLQEYKLAAETFDKYLAEFPKSERADMARLLLAESRYQLKQYPEAAASYARFVADFPASSRRPEALLRATKAHFLLKEHEKSLGYAETFLKENKPKLGTPNAHPALPTQIADALYYAGENSYALKKNDQAKAFWDELVKTQPNAKLIPDASEGLGWLHFDAKEFDQALPRFQLTAKTPDHPRAAWSKLMEGRCLVALKKFDEALAAFKAAPTLSGSVKELEAEVALRTAEALLAAERYPAMLDAFKKLAKDFSTAPSTLPALANAAFACTESQHQAESLALADLYLSIPPGGPDKPAILRLKARALGNLADAPEALKAAKKGVEDAAALTDPKRKAEEHPAALMLFAELSGPQGADSYREVVKLYPETRYGMAARYELARLASQAGRNDEALQQAQALIEQFAKQPDPKFLPELRRDALFAAAEFAFRKPDYKASEEYLKNYQQLAGETDPRADDVARKLAWCRHESNDDAGAAKILDNALKTWPKSQFRDEMLYLRALAAAKTDANDDALKFYDTLVAETPSSPFADDALYDAATMLYKQGRFEAVNTKLTALIDGKDYAASTLRTPALQLRASARLQAGKHAEAIADADTLLQKANDETLKSRLPALRLIKALALLAQPGQEAAGETALGELIKAGPADAPEVRQGILRRAYIRFETKKFKEAQEDFKALAAANTPGSDSNDAMLRLALCHKELKEAPQAKAILEQLLEKKLEGVVAFEAPFQLGNIAFEASDFTTARTQYEHALASAATIKDLPLAARSAANLNLAWSLKRLNDPQKAEQAFAEVVKNDPNGNFVAEALYERGRLLDELKKTDEAMQCWKEIMEKKPDSPQAEKALFLRSQKLAKSGRFADAQAGFEDYLKRFATGPSAREALCGLAESRMQAGDGKGAREAFMKALGEKGLDAELDDVAERALLGLAELSLKQTDGLAGKKLALRILTENPTSAWRDSALLLAGQCSEQLGEPEKAIGYYRKLISDFPKSLHIGLAGERLKALGAGQ